ncbi:MAG: hypothetical protein ACE5I7_07010 [Candidatus Binatia bacterium]
MTLRRGQSGSGQLAVWIACGTAVVAVLAAGRPALAQDCTPLLGLLQQGRNTVEISRMTGLTRNAVEHCRQELSKPIFLGPEGAPPLGAVGPAPRSAAGPAPRRAAGPPPRGAAGPPPVGREVRRLP